MIKRTYLLLALFGCISSLSRGQQFYIGTGGGYGFGAARSSDNNYKWVNDASTQKITRTAVHYSYGQGINAGIYAGYIIKRNLSVELGFSYLKSAAFDVTSETDDNYFNYSYGTTNHHYGSGMRLAPALRLAFGEKKISGYVKAGPVIGFKNSVTIETYSYNDFFGPGSTIYRTWENSEGLSFGAHATLGLNWKVSKRIGIYAEANGYYQQWSPKKNVLTRYEAGGVNQLSSLTLNQKEIDYVNEYSVGSSTNPNEPAKQTKIFLPFSSLGLNLGVNFYIGKTE